MKTSDQTNSENRDFSTISPSAKSLLLMKGCTNIPFARRTAELIESPNKYVPDFNNKDLTFWARTLHFENRYWSIDQLMEKIPVKNVLELSSGFSFRGLEMVRQKDVYYIDTDLTNVIATKPEFMKVFFNEGYDMTGKLDMLPLNALNEKQFNEVADSFPEGEICIVNEGLLMYLSTKEKEKLCRIIHKILQKRGGYWITADIYIKNKQDKLNLILDDKTKEFFEQHEIEKNRFESFEEAENFFKKMGFVIDKEAKVKRSKLSSFKYFMKCVSIKQLVNLRKAGKFQTTWRLKIAD